MPAAASSASMSVRPRRPLKPSVKLPAAFGLHDRQVQVTLASLLTTTQIEIVEESERRQDGMMMQTPLDMVIVHAAVHACVCTYVEVHSARKGMNEESSAD